MPSIKLEHYCFGACTRAHEWHVKGRCRPTCPCWHSGPPRIGLAPKARLVTPLKKGRVLASPVVILEVPPLCRMLKHGKNHILQPLEAELLSTLERMSCAIKPCGEYTLLQCWAHGKAMCGFQPARIVCSILMPAGASLFGRIPSSSRDSQQRWPPSLKACSRTLGPHPAGVCFFREEVLTVGHAPSSFVPSPPRTYCLGTGAFEGPLRTYYLGTWGARV